MCIVYSISGMMPKQIKLTSWAPIVVFGGERAVFKPDPVVEERQLARVVRI